MQTWLDWYIGGYSHKVKELNPTPDEEIVWLGKPLGKVDDFEAFRKMTLGRIRHSVKKNRDGHMSFDPCDPHENLALFLRYPLICVLSRRINGLAKSLSY
jgi:hypothetical protein